MSKNEYFQRLLTVTFNNASEQLAVEYQRFVTNPHLGTFEGRQLWPTLPKHLSIVGEVLYIMKFSSLLVN